MNKAGQSATKMLSSWQTELTSPVVMHRDSLVKNQFKLREGLTPRPTLMVMDTTV